MIAYTIYPSLIIFIAGLVIQFFRFQKHTDFLFAFVRTRSGITIKDFFLNAFLQVKLFKAGKTRWAIHFVLLLSFLYLLIVHGLYAIIADLFFDDYQPTLDPFQFLRNLSGVLVLLACLTFILRRYLEFRINQDRKIRVKGLVTVILTGLLICSGFLLEASKIISEPIFMEMVEEYSGINDEELIDLKLYWKDNYGVYFQEKIQAGPGQIENGQLLNEEYCLYCHSPTKSAFVSKFLAKNIDGAGQQLNTGHTDKILYWIHYGICLILLICLPFSRLFHVLLIPVASSQKKKFFQDVIKNSVSINVDALHACTNCGFCFQVCSVYPYYQIDLNPDVLPHSKIESVKKFLKDPSRIDVWQLYTGNKACTSCNKCTDICPSGIDLQSLWIILDKNLGDMDLSGKIDPAARAPLNEWECKNFSAGQGIPKKQTRLSLGNTGNLAPTLTSQVESFEHCIQCSICSNVCPIVYYDSNNIDMTPHQIMNLLRLGKTHLAWGTQMVRSCLTCYACQENCSQEIQVTDILLELRNAAGLRAGMIQKSKSTQKAGQ